MKERPDEIRKMRSHRTPLYPVRGLRQGALPFEVSPACGGKLGTCERLLQKIDTKGLEGNPGSVDHLIDLVVFPDPFLDLYAN